MKVIRFKNNLVVCVLVLAWLLTPASIYAQQSQLNKDDAQAIKLEVSPNRCVTLRQGQPCYVRVRFNWRSDKALTACLHSLEGEKITCWQSTETGSIVLPQTLPNTTEYLLIDANGVELNRTSIAVSWVYRKKRSKRRWRLF